MVPTYHVQCTYIQKSKLSPGLSHNNMKENEIIGICVPMLVPLEGIHLCWRIPYAHNMYMYAQSSVKVQRIR